MKTLKILFLFVFLMVYASSKVIVKNRIGRSISRGKVLMHIDFHGR